jgi:hypothetical protein
MGVKLHELARVGKVEKVSATCFGKQPFPDRSTAAAVMARMSSYRKFDAKRGINVYRCPNCHAWHIGGQG